MPAPLYTTEKIQNSHPRASSEISQLARPASVCTTGGEPSTWLLPEDSQSTQKLLRAYKYYSADSFLFHIFANFDLFNGSNANLIGSKNSHNFVYF